MLLVGADNYTAAHKNHSVTVTAHAHMLLISNCTALSESGVSRLAI